MNNNNISTFLIPRWVLYHHRRIENAIVLFSFSNFIDRERDELQQQKDRFMNACEDKDRQFSNEIEKYKKKMDEAKNC